MTILHPLRLVRAAQRLDDEGEAIGAAAAAVEQPDTGICDHGELDVLIASASDLQRGMELTSARVNAFALQAIEVDEGVSAAFVPLRPVD